MRSDLVLDENLVSELKLLLRPGAMVKEGGLASLSLTELFLPQVCCCLPILVNRKFMRL